MATIARKLRSGRSVWQGRRARAVAIEPLTRNVTTDVLIIGAGITGAVIADALAAAGQRVAVVDKRGLVQGSTVASTALVQYEIDTPLTALARKIGKDKAGRAWRRSRLAVEALAARLGELEVPDVARRDSLYLAGNVLDAAGLRREHFARRAIGLPERFLDRASLRQTFGVARSAALLGYNNLVIDPRKSAFALLSAAAGNGARIFRSPELTEVVAQRNGVTVTAADGTRFRCGHLVFATGYEVPRSIPCRHHKITSTWAIATVRQAKESLWPGECCIWEASDPYLYIRTTPEGRVICGGGDAEFSDETKRDALTTRKCEMLQRKLHRLLPRLDTTVEFAWAGSFGVTTTGLPIIGEIPEMPRCLIALGYGGNGTTYAGIAADVIVGAISGHRDADADLFHFPAHDETR